jgi:hypothetical protein
MAAARIALEQEHVVRARTDTAVMYDARRYLPSGVAVANFSAGLKLIDPTCRDLRAMSRQLENDAQLGLPLFLLLAATARNALVPKRGAGDATGGVAVGPVVLSHLGSLSFLRGLSHLEGPVPGGISLAATPADGGGITVQTSEWGRAVNATVIFDTGLVPTERVVAAVTRLVNDPRAVLAEAVGVA